MTLTSLCTDTEFFLSETAVGYQKQLGMNSSPCTQQSQAQQGYPAYLVIGYLAKSQFEDIYTTDELLFTYFNGNWEREKVFSRCDVDPVCQTIQIQ